MSHGLRDLMTGNGRRGRHGRGRAV